LNQDLRQIIKRILAIFFVVVVVLFLTRL
jgi:hypothetical protein